VKKILLIIAVTFVASVIHVDPSMGIPAWARKYKAACSTCHSMVPYLNDYGRTFKRQGYTPEPGDFSDALEVSNGLVLENVPPISVRFKSKLAIIPDDGDGTTNDIQALDAMHEVELLVGGRVSRDFSGWAEFEFEDEDGFNAPGLGSAMLVYTNSDEFNVSAGFAPLFWASPYNSYSDMRRLTLGSHLQPYNWKSANGNVKDERLRKSVQQVNVYGTLGEKVFYVGGLASARSYDGATNLTGQRPRTGFGSVVFQAAPEVAIGGFVVAGKEGDAGDNDTAKFTRFGGTLDGDALDDKLVYEAMFAVFRDDDERADSTGATPGSIDNNLLHASVTYAFSAVDDHPFVVGQMTFDRWENNTQTVDMSYSSLVGAISLYVRENVRITGEYHAEVDVPNNGNKAKEFILGGDIAF